MTNSLKLGLLGREDRLVSRPCLLLEGLDKSESEILISKSMNSLIIFLIYNRECIGARFFINRHKKYKLSILIFQIKLIKKNNKNI